MVDPIVNEKIYQSDLDQLDVAILNVLQYDASLTYTQLSSVVGASTATCQRRVVQLKRNGVIGKEVALLDPSRVGSPLMAVCEVTLITQINESFLAFEQLVTAVPQVQQCYRVSAGPDFILVLSVSDMQAYQVFAAKYFAAQHGVRNVRTFFATHRSKYETAIVLANPSD